MDAEKKERIENKLMKWLNWGAIFGLLFLYFYTLYEGLQSGVFWLEGEGFDISIVACNDRFSPAGALISRINMIGFFMMLIALLIIFIWADLHGYLSKMIED